MGSKPRHKRLNRETQESINAYWEGLQAAKKGLTKENLDKHWDKLDDSRSPDVQFMLGFFSGVGDMLDISPEDVIKRYA